MRSWAVAAMVITACRGKEPPAPVSAPPEVRTRQFEVALGEQRPPSKTPRHVAKPDGTPAGESWPERFDMNEQVPTAFGQNQDAFGTAHRVLRMTGDPGHSWALICLQRRDTNGDGAITFEAATHSYSGDRPSAYLVIHGGDGIEVERVEAISPNGGHLVLRIDGAWVLLDATNRGGRRLPPVHAAAFGPEGMDLYYVIEDGGNRIVRDQFRGTEQREIKLPAGATGGVVAIDRRWAAVPIALATRKNPSPSLRPQPWMHPNAGWCGLSSPFHDISGAGYADPFTLLWCDFETGTCAPDPRRPQPEPARRKTPDDELVPASEHMGPLHFKPLFK